MKAAGMAVLAAAFAVCMAVDAQAVGVCAACDTMPPRTNADSAAAVSASKAAVSISKAALSVNKAGVADSAAAAPNEMPDISESVISVSDSAVTVYDSAAYAAPDSTGVGGVAADTSEMVQVVDSIMRDAEGQTSRPKFVPDPQRALWLALILPGAGQIYNRKFWKLPIFYGGFLGCTYALMWNQQMYKDYSQAYSDIMDDDPNTASYLDMLPPNYDISGMEDRFKTIFKNRKDRYRRWRDLSVFAFVGVYILSVIDAYVDAQLSDFDISKDLSLNVGPAVIPVQGNSNSHAVGIGCGLNF